MIVCKQLRVARHRFYKESDSAVQRVAASALSMICSIMMLLLLMFARQFGSRGFGFVMIH
jgi:hypothetical protein